jgi:hypothetical protein
VGHTIDVYSAADDCRRGAILSLPQSLPDDRSRGRGRIVLVIAEGATAKRLYAKRSERAGADARRRLAVELRPVVSRRPIGWRTDRLDRINGKALLESYR